MEQEQLLQLKMFFIGSSFENCYLVRAINFWWAGESTGGGDFVGGGRGNEQILG